MQEIELKSLLERYQELGEQKSNLISIVNLINFKGNPKSNFDDH